MSTIPQRVLELAEDAYALAPLRAGDQRLVLTRCVVLLRLTPGPRSTLVTRLRLGAGEAADLVHEVRALLRAHGRQHAHWEVGSSATPPTLATELTALGLTPSPPPFTVTQAMVLPGVAPQLGALPADIQTTLVTTWADFCRVQELFGRCFGFTPDAAAAALMARDFARYTSDPSWQRYLAWHGPQAVAAADATLTPEAILLHGAATLPAWRQRGCYRALIAARWSAAVQQGTPYLLTQAGSFSAPVLLRAGFVVTAQIQNFSDPLL